MTVAEKKIEMVQRLLLLEDKAVLYEIDKLIVQAFQSRPDDALSPNLGEEKALPTFEAWALQFEDMEQPDDSDESGITATMIRKRIWAAEQSEEMDLETFWKRVAQN